MCSMHLTTESDYQMSVDLQSFEVHDRTKTAAEVDGERDRESSVQGVVAYLLKNDDCGRGFLHEQMSFTATRIPIATTFHRLRRHR